LIQQNTSVKGSSATVKASPKYLSEPGIKRTRALEPISSTGTYGFINENIVKKLGDSRYEDDGGDEKGPLNLCEN